jgi:hypothetical protein
MATPVVMATHMAGMQEHNSGGKDSRDGKRSGGCQGQSDVHHYKDDSSPSRSNKSASQQSGSSQRSSSFLDESVQDNHYVKQTQKQRVISTLFNE